MDDMNRNITSTQPLTPDDALRRDVLISQIIDAEGDGTTWTAFTHLAASDPGAWRELALAQRDHAALSAAVAREISVADDVELHAPGAHGHATISYRISRWSGWAAAAALAVTWLGTQFAAIEKSRIAERDSGYTAGILPSGSFQVDTAQDAISAYKQLGQQSGTVLGEIPDRVIIESRPLAGGRGFEVVYLRQFMERAQVAELYQVTRDDSGRQGLLVPVNQGVVKRNNRID